MGRVRQGWIEVAFLIGLLAILDRLCPQGRWRPSRPEFGKRGEADVEFPSGVGPVAKADVGRANASRTIGVNWSSGDKFFGMSGST